MCIRDRYRAQCFDFSDGPYNAVGIRKRGIVSGDAIFVGGGGIVLSAGAFGMETCSSRQCERMCRPASFIRDFQ